jgi:hypothetical protein
MNSNNQWKLVLTILGMATLALSVQAWAHGFDGDPRGGLRGTILRGVYGVPHDFRNLGRLVERLIYPCQNDCGAAESTCTDGADSTALTCAEQTCDSDIQTARTDCAGDRQSPACQSDLSALTTCIQPCVTAQSTTVSSCVSTFRACIGACSPTPTPTP